MGNYLGHVLKVERSERRSAFFSGTIHPWSSRGKDTGVGTSFWCSSDTGERSPMKIRDFGIIWDIDPEDQENDPNSKIQNVTSQRIFTKTKKIFFWYQTTLHAIKNSEKTPRDFGTLEIIGTSVQWGVRMEGTDDITLLFLNYLAHKLSRIFGPKEIE